MMSVAERKKVLFIVNPKSGKLIMKNHIFNVLQIFSDNGFETTVYMTRCHGDAAEAAKAGASKYDIIISCGGDGTLNEVVSGIMLQERRIPVGFIPAGTTNDLAETLDIPKKPEEAANVILSSFPVPNDVGLFNNAKYFNYVASCGAFTSTSYSTPQNMKNSLGHMAYVLEGIRTLNEIRPMRISVSSNEIKTDGKFIFVSVTNSMSVGGIFKFNPKLVNLNDGTFEVMLIRSPQTPSELMDIVYKLSNSQFDDDKIILFKTSNITFTFDESTDWTVDGEYAGNEKTVNIKNIHNGINIFRKPPANRRKAQRSTVADTPSHSS